jgi:septum formation protein
MKLPDRLFLASHSPRRRELIKLLGVPCEILDPPDMDEILMAGEFKGVAEDMPAALAEAKAVLALPYVREGYLICADTDVIHAGEILGKPSGPDDAFRMLKRLSGTRHLVVTGVSVAKAPEGTILTKAAKTKVKFTSMTDSEIRRYVGSGEPIDKAGAYGIQGLAAPFIESIEGCYFNVVGLPINLLYRLLLEAGFRFD